jgi:hypothetical protein
MEGVGLNQGVAMPFSSMRQINSDFHRVDDTCWWWATRWQFGWRGYGWYPCWERPGPAPDAIAAEAAPAATSPTESCARSWRDASGYRHSRRIC